jgi:peroxiredoxin Q/BCP
MLQTDQPAPEFELPDADMALVRLADYRGRNTVVLYFYHHDGDPGCTREAIEFTELANAFEAAGAVVLGISLDDPLCHEEFRDRHGLLVRLLSDDEGRVSRLYHTLREVDHGGVVKLALIRSTFIVDRAGQLRHALYNVSPRGHAADVLKLIQPLAVPAPLAADAALSR